MTDTATRKSTWLATALRWPSPQFVVSFTIIALFAYAYFKHPDDDTLKGALIAAFAGAWGFWIGSSSGSETKTQAIADQASAAKTIAEKV